MDIAAFVDTFGNFGIMGVIVFAFMKGWLVPLPLYEEMKKSKDKEIAYLRKQIGEDDE